MPESSQDHLDDYLREKFEIMKCLGRGAYGVVWKVKEKETDKIMALKKCFDAFDNSSDAQRTFREIIFLQELNGHENIVRLMNVMKAESNNDLYVLFDYMESDLQNVINAKMLTPIHNEYIMYQVLKALKYVHSAGVLHRDLKPANVLLNTNVHVRLCDFGLARTFAFPNSSLEGDREQGNHGVTLTDYVATRWYRAPELLLGATIYHETVDMWSIGCILGEMLSGKPILKGRSTANQLERIVELTGKPSDVDLQAIAKHSAYARNMMESVGNSRSMPSAALLIFSQAPEAARNMALQCLRFNPDKRPTAEDCLAHPFVEKFVGQEAERSCDKIIRMPVSDNTKLRAADYRSQIYALINSRRSGGMSALSLHTSPRNCSPRAGRRSQSKSPRAQGRSSRMSLVKSTASIDGVVASTECPWTHEGGAVAPPASPVPLKGSKERSPRVVQEGQDARVRQTSEGSGKRASSKV